MTDDKLAVTQEALKPCPFCGGGAKRITLTEADGLDNDGGDVITCIKCGASSHVEFGRKENLVSRWNTRFEAQARLAGERIGMERAAGIAADESIILSESRRPGSHGETRASHGKLIAMLIRKEAASIKGESNG